MRYLEHAPSSRLSAHLACYWSMATDGPAFQRVLPDGCMDILFDLDGQAEVVGTMTTALALSHTGPARAFGVRFRPGEAFALVEIPALDARDRVVPLADAWGRSGRELAEKVAEAKSDADRVATLDRELGRTLARPVDARVRRAVARIVASPSKARVARLARDVGLGERQLERLFDERVGIGPKALARVARLQRLVRRMRGDGRSWAHLATEVGYADQAHLAREVKRLAGVTPTELAREAGHGATWAVTTS